MNKQKNITYEVNKKGCHICTSHKPNTKDKGYFRTSFKGGRMLLHRFIYMQNFGEIKKGDVIRHSCDNRQCINPEHLLKGSHADNIQDRIDRNRSNCIKGANHHLAKLDETQVLEIFNDTITSHIKLAQKYNVSYDTIRNIRIGKVWKHITTK